MYSRELPSETSRKIVFIQRKTPKKTHRKYYLMLPHVTPTAIRICYSDNQKRFPVIV